MKNSLQNNNAASTQHFIRRGWFATPVASLLCIAMVMNLSVPASAEQWDNSSSNPFVPDNADQCTAYAWGRFRVLNGEALRFSATSGRDGGKLYDLAIETPTVYRDSVPVRGSLISWTKLNAPNDPGHTAIVEKPNTDGHGACDISEQNWPIGWGPNNKTLSADIMLSRTNKNDKGVVISTYTLRGYVNPNRPPMFGTISTSRSGSTLTVPFGIMDEDRRPVSLISAIFDGANVVTGTTLTGSMPSNINISAVFRDTSQLRRGKTYTFRIWATDFRGLRSSTATTFTW